MCFHPLPHTFVEKPKRVLVFPNSRAQVTAHALPLQMFLCGSKRSLCLNGLSECRLWESSCMSDLITSEKTLALQPYAAPEVHITQTIIQSQNIVDLLMFL